MKKYLISFFIAFATITINNQLYSQTYTVQSKSCGSCGKKVSNNSRVGMICPHCGVRWGYENQTKTYNNYNTYNDVYNNYGDKQSSFATTKSNVNLRSEPSTKSFVMRVIPANTILTIERKIGHWYYVKYSYFGFDYNTRETYGYVHRSTVRIY